MGFIILDTFFPKLCFSVVIGLEVDFKNFLRVLKKMCPNVVWVFEF